MSDKNKPKAAKERDEFIQHINETLPFPNNKKTSVITNSQENAALTNDEQDDFLQAVSKDTQKTTTDTIRLDTPLPKPTHIHTEIDSTHNDSFTVSDDLHWHDSNAQLSYRDESLSPNLFKKLQKGLIRPEASVDLHQLDRHEATRELEHFLARASHQDYHSVLIIHGKGTDKPVLKNLTEQFLRQDARVLAFHSAERQDGGTGAVYVLLKSNPKG